MISVFKSPKDGTSLFVSGETELLLLPTFFSRALNQSGTVWIQLRDKDCNGFVRTRLIAQDISATTEVFVIHRIKQFLNWLDEHGSKIMRDALDMHPMLDQSWLNHYIEEVLVCTHKVGEHSINQHLMALRYYYNYLFQAGLSNLKDIKLSRRSKATTRENTKKRSAIKYISHELRNLLYRHTKCIRDELILRTGAELGLRSRENLGFLIEDFWAGGKRYDGFKSLFKKMDANPDEQTFYFWMQGKFTKQSRRSGGVGRWIHINRSLLKRIEKYFNDERPKSHVDTLFLNASGPYLGIPISLNHGTTIFRKIRCKILEYQTQEVLDKNGQKMHEDHTYHVLRHSFGTDLFFREAGGLEFVDAITTTHPVFLEVARRMGHSVSERFGAKITASYIRSCHIKSSLENAS